MYERTDALAKAASCLPDIGQLVPIREANAVQTRIGRE
jgi:hypothetical protein